MIRKVLFPVVLLLAISAALMPLAACSNNPQSGTPGYILETLSKRGISFSFEYPVAYEKSDPNPYENLDYETDVVGESYIVAFDENNTSKQINIQLWNPTADYPDAASRLDYYAANIINAGQSAEIIERSPLQIAGLDAEKLVYTYIMENVGEMPSGIYSWVAAFDAKGQVWLITMATNMEPTDEAEADFEHLIESFKFQE
jgi:hypothetical protein